jgi:hypothetical protein
MQSDQIQNRFIGEILMEYYEGGDLGSVKRPVPEPVLILLSSIEKSSFLFHSIYFYYYF